MRVISLFMMLLSGYFSIQNMRGKLKRVDYSPALLQSFFILIRCGPFFNSAYRFILIFRVNLFLL
jgi:hypothetical protein